MQERNLKSDLYLLFKFNIKISQGKVTKRVMDKSVWEQQTCDSDVKK